MNKQVITAWFQDLQDRICQGLEAIDGQATFIQDLWERPGGGGGRSRIIQKGKVFEKGGVGFSAVHGKLPEKISQQLKLANDLTFYATGVSIVLHPKSPLLPIIHMNVRYFEMSNGTYWFGGGIDLTPHYIVKEDAQFFHTYLKNVCDQHDITYYPTFKEWADNYFFIPHRKETRGVGGIFFDKLATTEQHTKAQRFQFVQAVGNSFVPIYTFFAEKYKGVPYTTAEKEWQSIRRSRYVEFNLVYDRGTKFGLETNGRIESILMSLPPSTGWVYNYQPIPNSREEHTLSLLKKGIDWV